MLVTGGRPCGKGSLLTGEGADVLDRRSEAHRGLRVAWREGGGGYPKRFLHGARSWDGGGS